MPVISLASISLALVTLSTSRAVKLATILFISLLRTTPSLSKAAAGISSKTSLILSETNLLTINVLTSTISPKSSTETISTLISSLIFSSFKILITFCNPSISVRSISLSSLSNTYAASGISSIPSIIAFDNILLTTWVPSLSASIFRTSLN